MTDLRLSWPTLAERTPEPGTHCDWFDACYGCAGSGTWYTQSDQYVISGFEDAYGVMVSNHATTHWRLKVLSSDALPLPPVEAKVRFST